MIATCWAGCWAWLKAFLSPDRLAREWQAAFYRGQPVQWTTRGWQVSPRRQWPSVVRTWLRGL